MEKLFAGIFGVFLESNDSDFNDFIQTVMKVLHDKKENKWSKYIGTVLVLIGIAILLFFYLKLLYNC